MANPPAGADALRPMLLPNMLSAARAVNHRSYGTTAAQTAYGVELLLPAPVTAEPQGRSRRPIERVDLSVALGGQVTVEGLRQAIAAALADDLVELQLLDVYTGDAEAQRPRSATFRAIYAAEMCMSSIRGAAGYRNLTRVGSFWQNGASSAPPMGSSTARSIWASTVRIMCM